MYLFALLTVAAQPQAARDLNERGLAAYSRGEYAAAANLYLAAIPKWQALGDAYTAHLAITRMNLGDALAAQGKRAEARDQAQQALALYRRSLGVRDPRALQCMNALAGLDLTLGDYGDAAALIAEAVAIERAAFPANVRLATALAELATLRLRTGQIAEALAPAEESLSLAIQTAGEESLNAAFAYSIVAEVHRLANRPDRALPLYRRARAIYEKRLGPAHPRVAAILGQEALILAGEGELATAAGEAQRGLDLLARSCPGCDYEHWTLDRNLAQIRLRQGRFADAERLLRQAVALSERVQPESAESAEIRKQLDDLLDQRSGSGNGRRVKSYR